MGWTSYHVYGRINRKTECLKYVEGCHSSNLIKTAIKGTTFYALLESKKTGENWVLCLLTGTKDGDFYYKDIQCNPHESGVPVSIVKAFKPYDEENKKWKEKLLSEYEEDSKFKFTEGAVFKCTAPFSINWNDMEIKKDEVFYIKMRTIPRYKRMKKVFNVVYKNNNGFVHSHYSVTKRTFEELNKEIVVNG